MILNKLKLQKKDIFIWIQKDLLLFLLCAVAVTFLISFYLRAAICAFFPYDITFDEGFNIEVASWPLDGKSFYAPLNDYPYVWRLYTPLFFSLCTPFIALFGKQLFIGRLIAIFFTTLTGLYIYKIVNKDNDAKIPALISLCFFF
ncbi:MAG: hypothetical protein HQ579_01285, partial [Candidatus Omnitrophica bacterium]|nr:hypothetical protein [Candidatus Omnitrophota bacterium]